MRFLALLIVTLGFPLLELAGIVWIWKWAGWWTLAWRGLSILAGIKAARYVQNENKIHAVQRYETAKAIQLAE